MMEAPVVLCVAGSPVVFGSKSHIIIQCGPTSIGVLVVSRGSESLSCVAPANMSVMLCFKVGEALRFLASR